MSWTLLWRVDFVFAASWLLLPKGGTSALVSAICQIF